MRLSSTARELLLIAAAAVQFASNSVVVLAQPAATSPANSINAQATALLAEAKQLDQARRPREAIAKAEQAVGMLRTASGDPNAQLIATLQWLADGCERNEDFAKAQKTRSEILSATARLYGKGHWCVVAARVAMEDGKNLAALSPAQRQQLGPALAKHRDALAQIERGNYAAAIAPAQEAMYTRRAVLGQWHRDYGLSMAALGTAYFGLGDNTQAEKLLRPAVDVIRGALGKDNPETTPAIEQLGEVYQRLGDYTKAELLYSQAADVNHSAYGVDDATTARSMARLGQLYIAMQLPEKAEPLLKRSLATLNQSPDTDLATRLLIVSSLGQLYVQTKRNELAQPLLVQAVELAEKRYGRDHAATATALGNLGRLYIAGGDPQRAEESLLQARAILDKTVGKTHPIYSINAIQLAELYESHGRDKEAEPLLRQSLESSLANLEQAAIVQSERQQMAMAEDARRQLDRYLSLAVRAAEFRETAYRYLIAWKGSVLARQTAINAVRDDPSVKLVYAELEKVVSELPMFAWYKPRADQQEYWQRKTAELSEKKERLERLLAEKSQERRRTRQVVTLEQVRAALPTAVVLLDFAACESTVKPALNNSPRAATPDTARLLVFVVRSSEPVDLVDLGSLTAIDQHLDEWRADVENQLTRIKTGPALAHPDAPAWLRKTLWQPLEDRLAGASTVLLSPEGSISTLPFAGLPGRQPGTFLIEDWPIAVIPAAQALPELVVRRPAHDPRGRMLVIDAIDEKDQAPLLVSKATASSTTEPKAFFGLRPGMNSQSMRIKRLYEQRFGSAGLTAIDARGATEEAFRRDAPRNEYVHIYAHGCFARDTDRTLLNRPNYNDSSLLGGGLVRSQSLAGYHPSLLSGIQLSTAEAGRTWGEDGRLFSSEIQTLDLRGAELVMLASCETALGEKATGEGLVGIQRSFQIAGARTVVAAAWRVQVMATTVLMERFYDNLLNKRLTKLQALREAQIWMLREHDYTDVGFSKDQADITLPDTGHPLPPYFWAGFVLSGDWTGRIAGSAER